MSKKITYKDAGVDIEKSEKALQSVKQRITETYTSDVLSGVGLFGGFFDLSGHQCQHPVLVSSVDGVGTKLKVAILAKQHHTIGQDLVNHCINDIAVCGARPLFFLDYFVSGDLQPGVYEEVITGITTACKDAGVPLIGGETAEMPDLYQCGDYDLCGTVVGIVDKNDIIDGNQIREGDCLFGVAGNGLHTNGYTLARRVLLENFTLEDTIEGLDGVLGKELLKIHPNYYSLIQAVRKHLPVKGISHVTGGGIYKNTRRLLAGKLDLQINWNQWPVPTIFELIRENGQVPVEDMRQTFNLGIGLVFVVSPQDQEKLLDICQQLGTPIYSIGRVVTG